MKNLWKASLWILAPLFFSVVFAWAATYYDVSYTGAEMETLFGRVEELEEGDSPQFTGIELGHATENTLTASGGVLSVEGDPVITSSVIGTDNDTQAELNAKFAAKAPLDSPALTTQMTGDNGFIWRVVTTTDGHTLIIQVYDSNGTTWRDALTFENGNSADASATNWPRVHLGSNVALTGLGNAALGMVWGSEISSTPTNLEAAGMNQIYLVSAAVTVNMPAVGDCAFGDFVQFQVQDAAEVLTIEPDGTEIINMQGAPQAAGINIDSAGTAGDIITLIATTNADGAGGDGWMARSNVTLVVGD